MYVVCTDITGTIQTWMWCTFIVDCIISVTMCTLLSSRLAGFNAKTDGALMSLIYLSIESAVPTAMVSLVAGVFCSIFVAAAADAMVSFNSFHLIYSAATFTPLKFT